jgi:glyoxylase-like metal-dependent hydrolase (beta-lactamase superfamily II)
LRIVWRSAALLALTLLVLFVFRRYVGILLFSLFLTPPPLAPASDEGPNARWYDDYYTVEAIDAQTFAIGEPRYYQQNFNYLIVGDKRAILLDSGPGVRDIRALVASLTDLPVTAVPSHLHYDHIGNHMRYERLAVIDLPYLRERTRGGVLRPTYWEHLGSVEGFARPDLRVTEWWTPDSWVDLGGRRLRVLHTPGHTYDSISLWDEERALLFTGDYIHQGAVFAFLPGSSLGDYLRTAERLGEQIPENTTLLTAHRAAPSGVPRMATRDLIDLRETLRQIRAGEAEGAGYPVVFEVNERLLLLADWD